MLDVQAQFLSDRPAFLRADRQLGPIVTQMLIDDGDIALDDLGPEEGLRGVAEQLIHLLKIGGPDAVTDALAPLPAEQTRDMVAARVSSGHPNGIGLEELRPLAKASFAERRPGRATVHLLAGVSRSRRPRGRARKRR
jgi:hypothetical protein